MHQRLSWIWKSVLSSLLATSTLQTLSISPSYAETESVATSTHDEDPGTFEVLNRFGVNYFAIFYGPSVANPTSLQPTPFNEADPEYPVFLKNFLTLSYVPSDLVEISGSLYWDWRPVHGQELFMRDPYLRVAHNSIISARRFNWYSDLRFHLPVTTNSREADLLSGVQSFHILSFSPPENKLQLGTYVSARVNVFGSQGYGNDLELYIAPNIAYSFKSDLSVAVLYEVGTNHVYGDEPFDFTGNASELEPGVHWNINPNVSINPYLNFYIGQGINWKTTSFGMTLSWNLL